MLPEGIVNASRGQRHVVAALALLVIVACSPAAVSAGLDDASDVASTEALPSETVADSRVKTNLEFADDITSAMLLAARRRDARGRAPQPTSTSLAAAEGSTPRAILGGSRIQVASRAALTGAILFLFAALMRPLHPSTRRRAQPDRRATIADLDAWLASRRR
jgi:hypothetical protein